jgi:acetolactate synthase-1/3 small subunit
MAPLNTIAFIVENRPGVLFKVSNMFRRRGYNIESISVGPLIDRSLARMTVTVEVEGRALRNLIEQLERMVEVVRVKPLDPRRTVVREMALVKLNTSDPLAREEALRLVNSHHGLILDIDEAHIVAEVSGTPEEIDRFIEEVKPIGVVELSRTGATALERGGVRL